MNNPIEKDNRKKNAGFKILSIDGGGVRGIFPAEFLSLMEKKLNISIYEKFDMIVGTSTGSIIAAAIAQNHDLSQLAKDYKENASKIFQKKWRGLCGIIGSKYNSKFLENFLHKKLGDITLGQIEKPLILNATNVSLGEVYVFKSAYQKRQRGEEHYIRDSGVPLYKAVLASCSAPTYFDPVGIDGTLVCDGGIWANNPSVVGYTDAIKNFHKSKDNIKILSIGTGRTKSIYYQSAMGWGLMTGWKGNKFVEFIMSCQTEFPQNILSLINNKMSLRININVDQDYSLDNCKNIPMLSQMAKEAFTRNQVKVSNFLELN